MSPNEAHVTEDPENPEQGRKDLENELRAYSNQRGEQNRLHPNAERWSIGVLRLPAIVPASRVEGAERSKAGTANLTFVRSESGSCPSLWVG